MNFMLALKRKDGPNKHVKHDLGMDVSLPRKTANVRLSADVGYVYFTHAVINVIYYAHT